MFLLNCPNQGCSRNDDFILTKSDKVFFILYLYTICSVFGFYCLLCLCNSIYMVKMTYQVNVRIIRKEAEKRKVGRQTPYKAGSI